MATNIKDLTEQIDTATKLIETEIRQLKSARERVETIQGIGQNLVNGFETLYNSMNKNLAQNQTLLTNGSNAQISLIEEKFEESFSEFSVTRQQLTEFVSNYDGIIAEVRRLNDDIAAINFRNQFTDLQNQVLQPLGLLDESLVRLENTNAVYIEEIRKLNLAIRLDKLDGTIAGINMGLQKILNQIHTTNTDTRGLLVGINSTTQNANGDLNRTLRMLDIIHTEQRTNQQEQNKRFQALENQLDYMGKMGLVALFVVTVVLIGINVTFT